MGNSNNHCMIYQNCKISTKTESGEHIRCLIFYNLVFDTNLHISILHFKKVCFQNRLMFLYELLKKDVYILQHLARCPECYFNNASYPIYGFFT